MKTEVTRLGKGKKGKVPGHEKGNRCQRRQSWSRHWSSSGGKEFQSVLPEHQNDQRGKNPTGMKAPCQQQPGCEGRVIAKVHGSPGPFQCSALDKHRRSAQDKAARQQQGPETILNPKIHESASFC